MLTKQQLFNLRAYDDPWAESVELFLPEFKTPPAKKHAKWKRKHQKNTWIKQQFYSKHIRAVHTTLDFSVREMTQVLYEDFFRKPYFLTQLRLYEGRQKRIPQIGHPISLRTEIIQVSPPEPNWEDVRRNRELLQQRFKDKFPRIIIL